MFVPQKATAWSNRVRASLIAPSAFWAITCNASSSTVIPSDDAMPFNCFTISAMEIRLKSYV